MSTTTQTAETGWTCWNGQTPLYKDVSLDQGKTTWC